LKEGSNPSGLAHFRQAERAKARHAQTILATGAVLRLREAKRPEAAPGV
jgi:hypothetical protein